MRIAIPLFKDRVSPHFGSSSRIFLIDIENGVFYRKIVQDLVKDDPMEISRRILELGVDRIICGGIQTYSKNWLITKGIEVVDNQKGLVEEIIEQLKKQDHACRIGH